MIKTTTNNNNNNNNNFDTSIYIYMIAGDIIHGMPHYITRITYNKHRWFKLVLHAMIFGYTPQISGEQGSTRHVLQLVGSERDSLSSWSWNDDAP